MLLRLVIAALGRWEESDVGLGAKYSDKMGEASPWREAACEAGQSAAKQVAALGVCSFTQKAGVGAADSDQQPKRLGWSSLSALIFDDISCCCCSIAQSCPTLCNPTDCSTPGFPILHYFPEFAEILHPLSWWCHPTISSSVTPFFSCSQYVPASRSFCAGWTNFQFSVDMDFGSLLPTMNSGCWPGALKLPLLPISNHVVSRHEVVNGCEGNRPSY